MRATVTAAASGVIAENTKRSAGPEDDTSLSFIIKNRTATASVFLEIVRDGTEATSVSGFEWETSDGPLEVTLEPTERLVGIVASGGADQMLHVLRGGR